MTLQKMVMYGNDFSIEYVNVDLNMWIDTNIC